MRVGAASPRTRARDGSLKDVVKTIYQNPGDFQDLGMDAENRLTASIPLVLIQSAHKSKALTVPPQKFIAIVDDLQEKMLLVRAWKKLAGNELCEAHGIKPKDLGNAGMFLISVASILDNMQKDKFFNVTGKRNFVGLQMLDIAATMGDPDSTLAMYRWFTRAMAATPNPDEQLRQRLADSSELVKRLAREKNPSAVYEVAKMLEKRGRYAEAKETYIQAGDLGKRNGYAHGGRIINAVEKNVKLAEEIWRIGAQKYDNARCYSYLANLLKEDHPDYERFMTKAAASGIENAAYNLGLFWKTHKKNLEMAKEWFIVAANSTDKSVAYAAFQLKEILKTQNKLDDFGKMVTLKLKQHQELQEVEAQVRRDRRAQKKALEA
ncbi:Similar to hypothetical protein [Tuber melanosporum Mel28]; acc. no. XP_002841506 [Pyronema omphalodes CBS 100304]|uniref:Tetratricopeptide repeat protein n=1 Tax=Pyronema omphalodes (strain CBS 100304) TaxID=1076935 RepID=U4KUM4_PYROM|nr:Similar to hypothetical protein [Tuber melanosporum Mel28]; acc. no. XP_002841506 [Pyronema omphalodes CBS 100304]